MKEYKLFKTVPLDRYKQGVILNEILYYRR